MAEDRSSELGEEALDQVEPRAMLRRKGELEAACGLSSEPGFGLSGDVRRMVVDDQFDRSACWVSGIEKLEKFDELLTAMPIPDDGVHLTGEQINSGQQAERAMAFVLMIPCEGCVDAGLGRQIRRCRCDGLDSGLFICKSLDLI